MMQEQTPLATELFAVLNGASIRQDKGNGKSVFLISGTGAPDPGSSAGYLQASTEQTQEPGSSATPARPKLWSVDYFLERVGSKQWVVKLAGSTDAWAPDSFVRQPSITAVTNEYIVYLQGSQVKIKISAVSLTEVHYETSTGVVGVLTREVANAMLPVGALTALEAEEADQLMGVDLLVVHNRQMRSAVVTKVEGAQITLQYETITQEAAVAEQSGDSSAVSQQGAAIPITTTTIMVMSRESVLSLVNSQRLEDWDASTTGDLDASILSGMASVFQAVPSVQETDGVVSAVPSGDFLRMSGRFGEVIPLATNGEGAIQELASRIRQKSAPIFDSPRATRLSEIRSIASPGKVGSTMSRNLFGGVPSSGSPREGQLVVATPSAAELPSTPAPPHSLPLRPSSILKRPTNSQEKLDNKSRRPNVSFTAFNQKLSDVVDDEIASDSEAEDDQDQSSPMNAESFPHAAQLLAKESVESVMLVLQELTLLAAHKMGVPGHLVSVDTEAKLALLEEFLCMRCKITGLQPPQLTPATKGKANLLRVMYRLFEDNPGAAANVAIATAPNPTAVAESRWKDEDLDKDHFDQK